MKGISFWVVLQFLSTLIGLVGWLLLPQPSLLAGILIILTILLSAITLVGLRFHKTYVLCLYRYRLFVRFLLTANMVGFVVGIFIVLQRINRATLAAWLLVGGYTLLWNCTTLALVLELDRLEYIQVRSFVLGLVSILVMGTLLLSIIEVGMQAAFPLLPRSITQFMPQAPVRIGGINYDTSYGAREYPPGKHIQFTVDNSSGDLNRLTCLSAEAVPPAKPYEVEYTLDDHGFRNKLPWPDDVDVVFTGDSFVAAEAINNPFWKDFTPTSLELGLSGSSNLEQTLIVEEYGFRRSPEVVILNLFEGNDLTDNWEFYQAQRRGMSIYEAQVQHIRFYEYLVTFHLAKQFVQNLSNNALPDATACNYPVQDIYGNSLAFLGPPLALSTISTEELRDSDIFAVTRNGLHKIAQETQAHGAVFVLVFIPHKAHADWPGLVAADQIANFSEETRVFKVTNNGLAIDELITTPQEIAERLIANIDAQRNLLAELAAAEGFWFLDLTPYFQTAATEGEPFYFYTDTHWNQHGHDFVRDILRDFLIENELLPNPQ